MWISDYLVKPCFSLWILNMLLFVSLECAFLSCPFTCTLLVCLYVVLVLIQNPFFFLENAGELRFIIYRRRKKGIDPKYNPHNTTPLHKLQHHTTQHNTTHTRKKTAIYRLSRESTTTTKQPPSCYSITGGWGGGAVKKDSPRAPATAHNWLSSRARWRAVLKLGLSPSNTHLLRWFHKVHAPRITRELNPFLVNPLTALLESSHHLSNEQSESCGQRCWNPKRRNKKNQNCRAKTQDTSIIQNPLLLILVEMILFVNVHIK